VTSSDEVCPTCHEIASVHGCTVFDAGSFCRGPRQQRPAPPAGEWSPAFRAAVDRFQRESLRTQGIVVFTIPAGTPMGACGRCGAAVWMLRLPTGHRIAVDIATREVHEATCGARKDPNGR
jgi:hypothetical protein